MTNMTAAQTKALIDAAMPLLDLADDCDLMTPTTIEEALGQIADLKQTVASGKEALAVSWGIIQALAGDLVECEKPAPEPRPATLDLLQGRCECGKWKWGDGAWCRYGVMLQHKFCDECGSSLHPDGTATPSPLYAPVAPAPEQHADTVPAFKPLAEYSILDLSALLETMPERLGVAVRLLLIPPDRDYAGFAVVASPLSGVFFERDKDTAAREAVAMFLKGMEADSADGLPEDLAFLAHSRTD